MQEPQVLSVGAPHAGFALDHLPAGTGFASLFQKFWQIFRMNESRPAPALERFLTHVEVFQPASIEETLIAVRISTVQEGGSGIDDAPQYIFGGSPGYSFPASCVAVSSSYSGDSGM